MSSDRGIGLSGSGGGASSKPVSPAAETADCLLKELPTLSPTERRELASLASERDVELFWSDLLRLGFKLESRDKLEAAVSIYSLAIDRAPTELQVKAQARLAAVEGRGAAGARVEFHLRRFTHDAFDYKMILPMMAGSAVYNLAKGAALGRFAAAARPLWWMRGVAGRLSAASLGYFAEVPAFALSSRFLQGLDGKAQPPSLGHELSSAAITLGLLKIIGSLTQSGLSYSLGVRGAPGLRFAAGQVAMFGGLWSAHRIEEGLGLRQARDGDTAATDIFASMVSLGIGAQLGRRWLGPGHAQRAAEFEWRIQNQAENLNVSRPFSEKLAVLGPTTMMMSSESETKSVRPGFEAPQTLVRVNAKEVRLRHRLRNIKKMGGEWVTIADQGERILESIRQDRRWNDEVKSGYLAKLASLVECTGTEPGDSMVVLFGFANLALEASIWGKAPPSPLPTILRPTPPVPTPPAPTPPEPPPSEPAPTSNKPSSKPASSRDKVITSEIVAVSDVTSALRLFTVAGMSAGGQKDFQVRLLLPNLDQATWKIRVDAQGNLKVAEEGPGQRIEKVEGFFGRFRLHFGAKTLLLDLQGVQDRSGNFIRLELAPNQPEDENHIGDLFSTLPPRSRPVRVEHAEPVAFSTLRTESSGIQLRYQFYLSNGDLIDLTGQSNYRNGGQLEVKQASLRRFGELADWSRPLEISANRSRAGHFRVMLKEPSGYRFDFELKIPKGASERGRSHWTRLEVLEAPPPIQLRWIGGKTGEAELDSTEAEASIRGLSADALFGDLKAVEKMGALARFHDTAIWELKDLFEMSWESNFIAENFNGLDVIRLREKIGDAFRDASRRNPIAKKVLSDLENIYGIASLIEAAPALPPIPELVTPILPPAPAPTPSAPKASPPPESHRSSPPISQNPEKAVKKSQAIAKPVVSPREAFEKKVQILLRPAGRKSLQQGLSPELFKLIRQFSPEETRGLVEKYLTELPEAIRSKDWDRILPLLHITESLVPLLHPEARPEIVLRVGELSDQLMQLPESFRQMFAFNYVRAMKPKEATAYIFFQQRKTDSPRTADLRKNLDELRRIPPWDPRGGPGLVQVYSKGEALSSEEAAIFRVELWSSLQLLYLDFITHLKVNPDPNAPRSIMTTMSVLFNALLGASSQLEPEAREAFLDQAGIWRHGKGYRFQPFPGRFSEALQMNPPP